MTISLKHLGFDGRMTIRDLWARSYLGAFDKLTVTLSPHSSRLLATMAEEDNKI